jgi:PAS domain S-box-containing protein
MADAVTTGERALRTLGRLERQLEAAQQITHIGSFEWEMATGTVTWSDELYRIYGLEPASKEITLDFFLGRIHADDRARVQSDISAALQRGGRFAYRERILRPDGSVRFLDTVGEVLRDATGRPTGLLGTCRDITDDLERDRVLHRAQRVQAGERRALELLASGAPLREVLGEICLLIEAEAPESLASVLLVEDGTLRHGAAPSLPDELNRAIDGVPIGPKGGSCGTAAYRRETVIVEDIETDPLWEDWRDLVRPYGLRACWSLPILANDGRALGTFAIYYKHCRAADPSTIELLGRAAHVAAIAIERRWLDDQLRALTARIEAIREDERTSIAREIHDELGQSLTALKMDISWVMRRVRDPDAISGKLDEMSHATDAVIQSVRRISAELRPGILDDVGLRAAIEWQGEEFQRRTGTSVQVTGEVGDLQLERGLATAVFRIFQEALTNVARHAGATRVDVRLWLERGQLRLEIADDGIGLPEIAQGRSSLGLLGMRERARRLGGDCRIERGSEGGTRVSVTMPLRFPAERRTDTDAPIRP